MKFDSLDQRLRIYETAHDHRVLPDMYMVARLDGRSFSKLTADIELDKPFDISFRDHMVSTTAHVMDCGFNAVFGYTQSDEISVLLHPGCTAFGRKVRKLLSVLAGEASAHMSLRLQHPAVFDCRISQLPNRELVRDYFRWRSQDAQRNGLNAHSYWLLRSLGESSESATSTLRGLGTSEKNEILFNHGTNVNDVPAWQKRGTGVSWRAFDKQGVNPMTGEFVVTSRRRLEPDFELPIGDAFDTYLCDLIPKV